MRVSSILPDAGRLEQRWPQPEPAPQTFTTYVTVTATVRGPVVTATAAPTGTPYTTPPATTDDDQLSDWDSEYDDDELEWDDALDSYSAEDLACESGDEADGTGLGGYLPGVTGPGTGTGASTAIGTGTAAPSSAAPSTPTIVAPAPAPPAAAPSSSTPAPAPAPAPSSSVASVPAPAPTPPVAAPSSTSSTMPAPAPPASTTSTSTSTSTTTSTTSTKTSTTTTSRSTTFSTSIRKTKTSTRKTTSTSASSSSSTPISDSIITYATPAAVDNEPAPAYSATSVLLGGLYASDPISTLSPATPSATSTSTPELSTNSSRATAAGIAVGATAGVVFAASAIFILARMRIRRKAEAAGDRSEAGSSTGNRSPLPPPSPPFEPNHRRAMTNSELIEDVMAAVYGKETPQASPATPSEPVLLPPGMVAHNGRSSIFPYYDSAAVITPAPAGAAYGYQDGQDYSSSPTAMMSGGHSPLRKLADPYPHDIEAGAAGDRTTVMIWMGGVDSLPPPSLADHDRSMTPLPLTPNAGAPHNVETHAHPGYPDDSEPSALDNAVRIPSVYASGLKASSPSHRKSSFYPDDPIPPFVPIPEFSRPESPWDWNNHDAQARHEADARRHL
ncbi:hypothetical protein BROUX41_002561 [Berkeleyomyces rouxiae]|uniref:uncharacterized protein n=1 Tax=Berkeleyomyces rouxiae TaxID=2035830 RepID=UPI003B7C59A0